MFCLAYLLSLCISNPEEGALPTPAFNVYDLRNPREHKEILINSSNMVHEYKYETIDASNTKDGAERSLFYSFISISNSSFTSCVALGSDMVFGSGGAVYAFSSQVQVTDSTFENNLAMVGGSLSLWRSSLIISKNATFSNNVANYICGAICSSDVDMFSISGVTFANNSAHGRYGAVGCNRVSKVIIDRCSFTSNNANHSGGALGFQDCGVYVSYSTFTGNRVILPRMSFKYLLNNTEALRRLNDQPPGGGAIVFKMSKEKWTGICWEVPHFTTVQCCFNDNILNLGVLGQIDNNPLIPYNGQYLNAGSDIFFFGFSYWHSKGDTFALKEQLAIKRPAYKTETCEYQVYSQNTRFSISGSCGVLGTPDVNSTFIAVTNMPQTPSRSPMYPSTGTPAPTHHFIEPVSFAKPTNMQFTLSGDVVTKLPCPTDAPLASSTALPVISADKSFSRSYTLSVYSSITVLPNSEGSYVYHTTLNAVYEIVTPAPKEESNSLIYVIVGSIVGVLVIGALGFTMFKFLSPKNSNDEDSPGPDNTVTPIHYLDTESTVITQDNPLYLSGQSNMVSDDPFASDFSDKDHDLGFSSTAL